MCSLSLAEICAFDSAYCDLFFFFFCRLTGRMKKIVFKQFQLLLETSMLCILLCYLTHQVMVCNSTKRENLSGILKIKKIPTI